jgi:hypothetical protein
VFVITVNTKEYQSLDSDSFREGEKMKITLMDIMESLNSDNVEDAQAALHEWFVEQGKKVHNSITNPIMENSEDEVFDVLDEIGGMIESGETSGETEFELDGDLALASWEQVPYEEGVFDGHSEVMTRLMSDIDPDAVYDSGIWPDEDRQISIAYVIFTPSEDMDEARVDELSRDTQMAYAKKARKFRDQPSADLEKVGRRVVGLDMVANKARKERAALQYEEKDANDEEFDLYSLNGYPDLEVEQDGNPTAGVMVGYTGMVEGYFVNLLFSEMYDDLTLEEILKKLSDSDEIDGDDDLPTSEMPDEIKIPLAKAMLDHIEKSIEEEHSYSDDEDEDEDEIKESSKDNSSDEEHSRVFDRESNAAERALRNDTRANTVESLIAELQESFAGLEAVSDKLQNVEGAQVGEEGKVPVNTKSTLPSKKGDKRVGGEAVEIKSKDHKGHALEKAPKVKDAPVKHHIQNSKDDPKKVKTEKSALLNKMDGSVNTQSPISGKGAKGLKK